MLPNNRFMFMKKPALLVGPFLRVVSSSLWRLLAKMPKQQQENARENLRVIAKEVVISKLRKVDAKKLAEYA